MRLHYLAGIPALGLALTLGPPANAIENDPFDRLESFHPEVLLRGIIREDDVSLLFGHLRESIAAAARGEEARESAALNRRAEQIQREVAARGGELAGVVLSAFESAVKQMVRERLGEFRSTPPRTVPYPRSAAEN